MIYFKNVETGTIGQGADFPPVSKDYIELTAEQYEQEMEVIRIASLNKRRAELLEQQQTETDGLNLLLIQRELDGINAYFAGKE